jgi:hypothetical protein
VPGAPTTQKPAFRQQRRKEIEITDVHGKFWHLGPLLLFALDERHDRALQKQAKCLRGRSKRSEVRTMRTHARSRSSYGTKRMGQLVAMLMGDLRRRARDAIHGVGATKAHCLAVCLSESFNAFYSKRTKISTSKISARRSLFPFQFH